MDGRKEKRRKRRQTRKTRDRWTDTRSHSPALGMTRCDAGHGLLKTLIILTVIAVTTLMGLPYYKGNNAFCVPGRQSRKYNVLLFE